MGGSHSRLQQVFDAPGVLRRSSASERAEMSNPQGGVLVPVRRGGQGQSSGDIVKPRDSSRDAGCHGADCQGRRPAIADIATSIVSSPATGKARI